MLSYQENLDRFRHVKGKLEEIVGGPTAALELPWNLKSKEEKTWVGIPCVAPGCNTTKQVWDNYTKNQKMWIGMAQLVVELYRLR